MPSIEVIYLSRKDTLDTVRELLHLASPGAQVWLVAPWRLRLALNLLNLKLLRRTADADALDLRLVSRHVQTRALAREAGVAVYRSVPYRLRRYRRRRRRGAAGLLARVVPVRHRLGPRWRDRKRSIGLGTVLLSLLVILGLGAVLLGVALALVPRATVTLEPVARPVSGFLDVTADSSCRAIDYGKAILPGRVVQVIVEGPGDTPTSGRMDVPEDYASGEVVFSNRTSSPVVIPKGTTVRTSSGVNIRFATMDDIELPPVLFGHKWVGVIALDPGPSGNVGPLTISVVEGEVTPLVSVLNPRPTQGGSIKRVPVVAYQDFDRLRADMIERLQQEAYVQLVSELERGEFVPSESLDVQVMSQHFGQVVDERTDFLSMNMKVVARGVAVSEQDLEALATRFLESQAEEGSALIESSLVVRRSEETHIEGIALRMRINAYGVLAPVVDVERAKRAIRGKEVTRAVEWFGERVELRHQPQITMFPEWWQYLPWLPGRIEIILSAGEG